MTRQLCIHSRNDWVLIIPEPFKAQILWSTLRWRVGLYITDGWIKLPKTDFRSENPAAIFVDPNINRWNKRHHVGSFRHGDTKWKVMRQWQILEIWDDWSLQLPERVISMFHDKALFLLLRWQSWIEWFALSFQNSSNS